MGNAKHMWGYVSLLQVWLWERWMKIPTMLYANQAQSALILLIEDLGHTMMQAPYISRASSHQIRKHERMLRIII